MSQNSFVGPGGTARLDFSRRCAVQSCTWHPLIGSQHCLEHQGGGATAPPAPGGSQASAMQDFMGSLNETHYGIRPVAFVTYSPAFSSLVGNQAPSFLQGSADTVKVAIPLVQWHFDGEGSPPVQRDFNAIFSDLHALCIDAPSLDRRQRGGTVGTDHDSTMGSRRRSGATAR